MVLSFHELFSKYLSKNVISPSNFAASATMLLVPYRAWNQAEKWIVCFLKELQKDTYIAIQIPNVIRITCPFAVSMKIELNLYSHSGSTPVSGTIDLSGLIVSIINSSTICFKEASESSFVSRYFLKLCPKRSACKVGNEFYKYVQELFAFELLEEV